MKNPFIKSASSLRRELVLQITRNTVLALVTERSGKYSDTNAKWVQLPWQGPTNGLPVGNEAEKLSALLHSLVEQEKLSGCRTSLNLAGDFCVTRVVAGTHTHVQQELLQLQQRCERYLSLGSGPKAIAQSRHPLDARREIAWLTVANQTTLQTMVGGIVAAGLKLDLIEHSLIALARILGQRGLDQRAPVLIIEIGSNGVDLGVTYQGKLLLDYRPGGLNRVEKIPAMLDLHLERIQRYCLRILQKTDLSIAKIVLCGEPEAVAAAQRQFDQAGGLRAEIFTPVEGTPDWNWPANAEPGAELTSLVGTCKARQNLPGDAQGPNLMDFLHKLFREPLLPLITKNCWPIAAAVALVACLWSLNWWQEWKNQDLAARCEVATSQELRVKQIQYRLAEIETKIRHYERLGQGLEKAAWSDLLAKVGECLPSGVWLENLRVERDRKLVLSGPSLSEGGIYEFLKNLKTISELKNIDLEATHPTQLKYGAATVFDIKGNFADRKE
ncbi:MAG: PilN domain-containing protein [Pirellulales bacterium]|nr:PilN domain-containing protein [Pirellulales bacterium]